MASLAQRITDLAAAVRGKFNAVTPRLLPAGGATGDALRKVSATNYDAAWGSDWTYVKQAADLNVTVITPTDTGLTFTPAAGKTYVVQGLLMLRTNNTAAGARPGVVFPTGLNDQIAELVVADTATSAVLAQNTGAASFQAATAGLPNITTSWFGRVEALLVAGVAPAGAFKITLQTETAGRIATLRAGSYIRWREI
jgi:hypothetical protein